ncbi:uncharacterized protein PV09_09104 [Verruconis gallopava]|uniref:Ubiquitin-like protease family profile domain-containing protein n=1 Tax=Verruconis gallopava TaxID=253628 RepID=A0A0D1ZXQ8_9PEZI|nr:uncharacterized protein PV09_09104 [Verruconis gallopava]KIV99242.1 hypothetical protein PV09_09104 [Verruconis gallopava]
MKRAAEDIANPATKRRFYEMPVKRNTMPGAWPEKIHDDLLDHVAYSSLLYPQPQSSPTKPGSPKSKQLRKSPPPRFPFPTEFINSLLASVISRFRAPFPRVDAHPQSHEESQSENRGKASATKDVAVHDTPDRSAEARKSRAGKTPITKSRTSNEELRSEPEEKQTTHFKKFFDLPPAFVDTPIRPKKLPASYVGENKRVLLNSLKKRPRGYGTGQYDPADIVPTPVKAARIPKSPRRWSPYHYEHGVNRPVQSILRSSRPSHRPFEPTLFIESPQKYLDEDESPVDQEGDLEMMEADIPRKSTKISFSGKHYSWLTGETMDSKHGVWKYYVPQLAINEPLGPQYSGYREPKPEFDPDESFLESPKPKGFGQEQEKSPSKTYVHDDDEDDGLTSTMASWYREADSRLDADNEMSAEMKARYAKEMEERAMEEIRKRHAKEQAIRDEIARRNREEHEAMMARQRERERLELMERERLAAEEAEEARRRFQEMAELEQHLEAVREAERTIIKANFTPDHVLVKKTIQCLKKTNPDEVVIENGQLSRHDLGTLLPTGRSDSASGWLNDNIVNTALSHLVKAANLKAGHNMSQTTTPAPFWAFNSGWFNTIGDGSGIKRWARKRGVNLGGTNLLSAKKILFPVCLGAHWTITVLDCENRTIETMNSLDVSENSHYNAQIGHKVMAWLRFELGKDFIPCEWQARRPVTCLQTNAKDCGVFTIMNGIARVKNIPTWSMRQQVNAARMGTARWWIAALLVNGGFTPGEWDLHVDFKRKWDGAFIEDPDYIL